MEIAISILTIVFEAFCAVFFFDAFFHRRSETYRRSRTFFTVAVCTALAVLLGNIHIADSLRHLLNILVIFLVPLLLHKALLVLKLVLSLLFYFLVIGVDFAFIALFSRIFSATFDGMTTDMLLFSLTAMASKSVLFIIVIVVRRFWNRGRFQVSGQNAAWAMVLCPPAVSVVSILVMFFNLTDQHDGVGRVLTSFSTVGLFVLSLIVFYIMESIKDREEKTIENALLKQQVAIEMDSVLSLSGAYDKQKSMLHDYSNQVATIRQLLAAEKYERASAYVQELAANIASAYHKIETGNDVVDAVLNQKELLCQKRGIAFEIRVDDLSGLPVRDEDFVIILANVIDNAMEACEQLPQNRYVQVLMRRDEGQLVLSVKNPVAKRVKIDGNTIATTKKDAQWHGLGLRNVASALEKYGADYELISEEGWFQFVAIFPF